jgi:hypothetical protein
MRSVQRGYDTMGRFSERVAHLIELLEADYLKRGQRVRVDEMIWEAEKCFSSNSGQIASPAILT